MDLHFGPSARRFLDNQSHQVRSDLINLSVWLAQHPYFSPDDPRKKPFLASPVVLRLYQDDDYWVVYYLNQDGLIIANIGNASEVPSVWRSQ